MSTTVVQSEHSRIGALARATAWAMARTIDDNGVRALYLVVVEDGFSFVSAQCLQALDVFGFQVVGRKWPSGERWFWAYAAKAEAWLLLQAA